jgi:hypothetical protein
MSSRLWKTNPAHEGNWDSYFVSTSTLNDTYSTHYTLKRQYHEIFDLHFLIKCRKIRLRAMQHSTESWLRAMQHSTKSWLRAMQHSAESWLRAMQHNAESWLRAMQLLSWINSWFMNISYYIILLVLFRDVHLFSVLKLIKKFWQSFPELIGVCSMVCMMSLFLIVSENLHF